MKKAIDLRPGQTIFEVCYPNIVGTRIREVQNKRSGTKGSVMVLLPDQRQCRFHYEANHSTNYRFFMDKDDAISEMLKIIRNKRNEANRTYHEQIIEFNQKTDELDNVEKRMEYMKSQDTFFQFEKRRAM